MNNYQRADNPLCYIKVSQRKFECSSISIVSVECYLISAILYEPKCQVRELTLSRGMPRRNAEIFFKNIKLPLLKIAANKIIKITMNTILGKFILHQLIWTEQYKSNIKQKRKAKENWQYFALTKHTTVYNRNIFFFLF